MKTIIKKVCLLITAFLISSTLFAQDNKAYEKAKTEIQEQFGTFPSLFKVYPKHALAGAWENFKQLNGPTSKIPPKYRELIQLAVAAQIPCSYCIYFHTESAKAFGASQEEIQEAIAHGAATRQWSMILQGNETDLEAFKTEFDGMMKYMSEKAKK
ncbi:carboxymuconolactone decarboxylase family protein [Flavobacterium sp. K5-23]|uniref:carboxymuconolactone decarboxylase family protein n=1 Tax=Flavobacterium sp. K5-23 TaxID=2746225 RepID=UPI00200EE450|nr:carboxymuconolactone decarboxylase family protein [Flavobacterium sp. K5-23]UQD56640.1 carboxymuconolactone decarboxylase family protein [Flavobacterium sp. K5-23]